MGQQVTEGGTLQLPFETKTIRLPTESAAQMFCGVLISQSIWFSVTPLPDDCFDFRLKVEESNLGFVKSVVERWS